MVGRRARTADAAPVPHALSAFRARRPGVRVVREEGLTPALPDRPAAGHPDLAVVSATGRAPLEAYALHHLLDEPLYVAVPDGHPLAGHDGPVPLARFAGSPRPEGTLLGAALRRGFRPRVAHVVAEWTAGRGYVAAGLGVALVPGPRRRVRPPRRHPAAGARRGRPGALREAASRTCGALSATERTRG
ncbi:LysR substrate-binding domain-containing protein [Streptomyces griseomycini]|uniref:DNA-binding transcriptional LysR family regulator n=1 Tax=Streptomyces griseomycini TaxID=66895 RepID=A0A7W7PNN6_9ACTN|nr:LysR substrate-binding domain-containing protein [Streptomyces griseomycini]MBB4896597.1 DNA-binding transcriptional LysR family regulator [Streptomyces griseomycini]GGR01282.1 hypothetical protein GCM10015536_02370 [Streptomyces griseomycini]